MMTLNVTFRKILWPVNIGGLMALMLWCSTSVVTGQEPHGKEAGQISQSGRRLLNLSYGKLQINPFFSVRETYSTNISRTDSDEEHDWITTLTPGVAFRYHKHPFRFETQYSARVKEYARRGDTDDTGHTAQGQVKYRSGPLFAGAKIGYNLETSPLDVSTSDRLETSRLNYTAHVGIEPGKSTFKLSGKHMIYNVQEETFDYLDYETDQGKLSWRYDLSREWGLRGDFTAGRQGYNEGRNDNDFQEYSLGAQWKPNKRFGMILDVGYRDESYDTDTDPGSTSDYSSSVVRLTSLWQPWEDGSFTFSYGHSTKNSTLANYVTQDRFTTKYEHTISEKLTANTSVEYSTGEESDDAVAQDSKRHLRIRTGANYQLAPGVSSGLTYSYGEKMTDDDTGEYLSHRVSLNVGIQF